MIEGVTFIAETGSQLQAAALVPGAHLPAWFLVRGSCLCYIGALLFTPVFRAQKQTTQALCHLIIAPLIPPLAHLFYDLIYLNYLPVTSIILLVGALIYMNFSAI